MLGQFKIPGKKAECLQAVCPCGLSPTNKFFKKNLKDEEGRVENNHCSPSG
jgi:hypothetical protein